MTATLEDIRAKMYAPAPPVKAAEPKVAGVGITMTTAGELGDAAYILCVLKAIPGGPHNILLRKHPGIHQTSDKILRNPEIFTPLALSQSYVNECRLWHTGDPDGWCSSYFRDLGFHNNLTTLVQAHARHGMSVGVVPKLVTGNERWLDVPPDQSVAERVVIARTTRWRNHHFQWKAVHQTYGSRLLMLGEPDEHADFEKEIGPVEYHRTRDLMDAAKIIAGSWLYISNQTSLWAIAEGLKVRRIQETSFAQTDCVFSGGDVQHVIAGEMTLPLFEGGSIHFPSSVPRWGKHISRAAVPPRPGWICNGLGSGDWFDRLAERAVKHFKITKEEADNRILEDTCEANPTYFGGGERDDLELRLRQAREKSIL